MILSLQLPEAVVDWSQVISAGLSLLALVLALFAIVNAKQDLANERRIAHELDVLRSIADSLRSFGSSSLLQLMRTYLHILPGNQDFPIARAQFDVRATDEAKQRLAEIKQSSPPSPIEQYHATQELLDIYRGELYDAIDRRASSHRPVRSARS
ncbi:hypothetical protein [Pseudonocardia hierapolitana]|uniref:hypothetical protein n=1 Tax=Pseudonocardia hierapolitana TaxID=1128676 RepID=UPI0011BDD19C|nr:hypothetical protein [Pseudonocardia hierapolitana]